jgi:HD superfamily phosphohydrolase YqeK
MSTLAKLIFVADMIEEDRFYQGVEELRKAYEVGLDYCFKECLKEETVHLINRKKPIYVETLNAYEYYINGDK